VGTFTDTVSLALFRPSPPQVLHGCATMLPSPSQRGHADTFTNWPNTVCCTRRTWPRPWHCGHTLSPWPPRPLHVSHFFMCVTRIFFSTPVAISSSVSGSRTCRSSPRLPPLEPRPAAAASAAAEQVLERALAAEVAHERAQGVGQVEAGIESAAAEATARACAGAARGVAELVVARTLLRIVQHLVGFGGLLELRLGVRIARVAVGMPLHGELAVRLLDLLDRRAARDAEHLVIVALRHQWSARAHDHACGAQRAVVAGVALLHLLHDRAGTHALGRPPPRAARRGTPGRTARRRWRSPSRHGARARRAAAAR
jgi:hypothetical protein